MNIKVCGLKTPEQVREINKTEVDYVGFIFHQSSPRFAEDDKLAAWLTEHPRAEGEPERVGVFVNAELDYILNTVHDYQLDWVQLHGEESPGYCQELQLLWSVTSSYQAKIIKAFKITPDFDWSVTNSYVSSCQLFLFDTGGQSSVGGTGIQWDWSQLENYQGLTPFLLSGGIGPKDAKKLEKVSHPQLKGIDVNSGFETAPGLKDLSTLATFVAELKN
ncbi:phosphoribosylanthranilate isomerase [Lewinellaceae bacterium SD302]|nr:phosphoribosylanthranilate isomerase [Lewinellaceae bacterium SD302]